MASNPNEQTVTALVENKAGVLARVAGLVSRRGYNIVSLAVAPTDDERFSRITFVYDIGSAPVEQVLSQVNKLINVIHIEAIDPAESVERELLLGTFHILPDTRAEVFELVEQYQGEVVESADHAITASITNTPEKLDEFEEKVRKHGIVAIQRSGRLALSILDSQQAVASVA